MGVTYAYIMHLNNDVYYYYYNLHCVKTMVKFIVLVKKFTRLAQDLLSYYICSGFITITDVLGK